MVLESVLGRGGGGKETAKRESLGQKIKDKLQQATLPRVEYST